MKGCLKHGFSRPRNGRVPAEYTTWQNIKERCGNPRNTKFANYGGRGIAVCERWKESFQAFLDDMGLRPSAKHTIDRIDSNGAYEPGNCRWATWTEQQRNRANNRILTAFGKSLCIAEWAELLGVRRMTISRRVNQLGWSDEEALSIPVRPMRRVYP